MKLVYWYSQCLNDSDCYSIVGRTKKSVLEQLVKHWNPDSYGPIEKRTIYYKDSFELFEMLTGEGGSRGWGTIIL